MVVGVKRSVKDWVNGKIGKQRESLEGLSEGMRENKITCNIFIL